MLLRYPPRGRSIRAKGYIAGRGHAALINEG
jgi:hypothetical protein